MREEIDRLEDSRLIDRLLDQNDRLISALESALRASNPVAVIQALNPPWSPEKAAEPPEADPYSTDPPHPERQDPWGDPDIPLERFRPGAGGWVDAKQAETDSAPPEPNDGSDPTKPVSVTP